MELGQAESGPPGRQVKWIFATFRLGEVFWFFLDFADLIGSRIIASRL